MSDLIDRQAAIDEVHKNYDTILDFKSDGRTVADSFEDIINALPSAQPEPQWIPCSERMPEDGKWCLFTDGVSMSVERYKADAMDHFFPEGRWFSLKDAVAWMPLPELYKGGGKDGSD